MENTFSDNLESTNKNLSNVTPMMEQYWEIKKNHLDCLLFYRMGDFFELFFDDAIEASKILNITLTSRGKYLGKNVPMCGVPYLSVDFYLSQLVKANKKVAICEQVESPEEAKKRGYKAVVKREVIRIVTAGTLLEDELINENKNNFLMSIINVKNSFGISIIDISTGDFYVEKADNISYILDIVGKYTPSEILIPESFSRNKLVLRLKEDGVNFSELPDSKFNFLAEEERVKELFKVSYLDGIDNFSKEEIISMGSLAEYINVTQQKKIKFSLPKKINTSNYMFLPYDTFNNLEIWRSINGKKELSLFEVINKTVTAMGKRLLISRLSFPILGIKEINKRFDAVDFFIYNPNLIDNIATIFSGIGDLERATNRIIFKKYSPIDLGIIKKCLIIYKDLCESLKQYQLSGELLDLCFDITDLESILNNLILALSDELPNNFRKSGYIKKGYNKKLDELRELKSHSEELIRELQQHYITETGITTLRLKNNNMIGWFVEIPISQKDKITEEFKWKQTISNNIRYTTVELDELQQLLNNSESSSSSLELELFDELIIQVTNVSDRILSIAKTIAVLDLNSSFAKIAINRKYSRPKIVNEPILNITDGRHPVVELVDQKIGKSNFVNNDCNLNERNNISIITGPNMSGKSTYLRQNAIIILLSHIGCFVPAKSAVIGVVDKLFSRIGASDDLVHGKSTFMVEMIETAAILNQSTKNSFVILDEVGRGTSTFDGLSIAIGVVDHIYKVNKCRTLFATHYHEFGEIKSQMPNLIYQTLSVKESDGFVIFDHKIKNGIADKSYGIYVAKLAGIPDSVIEKSKNILNGLENKSLQLPLLNDYDFNIKTKSKVEEKIAQLNIDEITPKNAIEILYDLKNMVDY